MFEEVCVERFNALQPTYTAEDDVEPEGEIIEDDESEYEPNKPIVILTVRERDGGYSGGLDTILRQFDRRTARGVVLESHIDPTNVESLSLEIGGDSLLPEVVLSVKSADSAVGRAAFARISDEFERGVPWWARGPVALRVLAAVVTVGLVAACAAGLRLSSDKSLSFAWGPAGQGAVVGAFTAPFLLAPFSVSPAAWLFPKFEVTGDGVSTTSRRILATLGLLVTIPIGVFVNYIS